MKCKRCGQQLNETDNFCRCCGEAVVFCAEKETSDICLNDLKKMSQKKTFKIMIEEYEKKIIKTELAETGGNKAKAARNLKISRAAFIAKVKKYNL